MATIDNSMLGSINQTPKSTSSVQDDTSAANLQSNFMTLLVAQLKNQDPMKPMENAELTSQLAQLNMVDGIQDLKKALGSITSQISTGQQLQATALIGHGVLVPGDRVLVGSDGATTPFGVEVPKNADSVKVSIVNSGGVEARSFDMGSMPAGSKAFTWDGRLSDGSIAPEGSYVVKVVASTGSVTQEASALAYGVVSGVVKTEDGGALLDLGGTLGRVTVDTVRQVY